MPATATFMRAAQEVLLGLLIMAACTALLLDASAVEALGASDVHQDVANPTPAAPAALKTCYWFEGYDARGMNNTSWDGPVRTPLRARCVYLRPPTRAAGCWLRG